MVSRETETKMEAWGKFWTDNRHFRCLWSYPCKNWWWSWCWWKHHNTDIFDNGNLFTLFVCDPTSAKTDDDFHGDDNGKVIDTTALLMLMMPSTNFTLPFLHIPEHLRPCRCRRTSGKDVCANFKRFEQQIRLTTDSASAYCSQCNVERAQPAEQKVRRQ